MSSLLLSLLGSFFVLNLAFLQVGTSKFSLHQCPAPNGTSCRRSNVRDKPLDLCVGIRGNGDGIYYHFTALARVVEQLGPIDAAAGGSSGSIATYILDSIQSNPLVYGAPCSEKGDNMVQRARTSFLLKSVQVFDNFVNIVNPYVDEAARIQKELEETKILERLKAGGETAKKALKDVHYYVTQPHVKGLINPEFISMVKNSPDPIAHAYDSLSTTFEFAKSFILTGPSFFVRATPLRMEAAGVNQEIIGGFYAGYEPLDMEQLEYILDQCAVPALGKDWDEAKYIETESGDLCGNLFDGLVTGFVKQRKAANQKYPSRLDEKPRAGGAEGGMASIIAVGVLRDAAIKEYYKGKEAYFAAKFNFTWNVTFNNVGFGYWGDTEVLKKASEGKASFQDPKSRKTDLIGQATWRELLVRSPGEPGLSNGIPGRDDRGKEFISIGGWCDLVPSQILSSIGCDRIVLINRPGSSGDFQDSVEITLGATPTDLQQLNDLDDKTSGWSVALTTADASMCGDYNAVQGGEALSKTGWTGPIVTDDGCLAQLFEHAPGLEKKRKLKGC